MNDDYSAPRFRRKHFLIWPLLLAGMFVFVDLAGLGVPIAAPAVTVLVAAFNFVGSRWALRAGRAQSKRQT